uniref:X8 domain-containing protein n=2 Tax=Lotus japonicus TaxID=34305 RepID=I3S1T0_LOTJA|nr:unknown [Lotus japonicus]
MRQGPIDAYLFSLVDEDDKSIQPGNFERHWGLFYFDGQPKYPVNLIRSSQHNGLVGASGVDYLSKKWCVLKPSANLNDDQLAPSVTYACENADCTSLGYGTTCGNLDVQGNISYAFNSYFQRNDQMDSACKFSGLAMVTDKDPSGGSCKFRIMIQTNSARLNESVGYLRTVLFGFVTLLLLCNLPF